jgi:DNA adenine methylase
MEQHLCACGCGQVVNSHDGKGRPNRYFSGACRVRAHRNKGALSVTKMPDPVTKMKPVKPPGPIKPILKYPGAKWSRAKWIISHFPPHRVYLEPYCGSAAVFFNKDKVPHEVLNDVDGHIINLLDVLRRRGPELARMIDLTPWAEDEYNFCEKHFSDADDELERARRFLVRCWQAHGTLFAKKTNSWRHKGIHGPVSTTALWQQVPERLLAASHRLKDAEIRNRPA